MSLSNKAYWSERQKLNAKIERSEKQVNKKLAAYYKRQAANLSRTIGAYYAAYGEGNVLQYRDLLGELSDGDRDLLYRDWDAFAEKYPQYASLMPVRQSIYQLNRLEGLKTSMELQSLEIGAVEEETVRSHLEAVAAAAETSAKGILGQNFNRADTQIAAFAVDTPWYEEESFSGRIWANREALTKTLQSDILNGIIRGDDYKTISKQVEKKLVGSSRANIERLVFTEDTYLANEAAMAQYENDPDFEEYEFLANSGCCEICDSLNGERFKISERKPGENFPPLHPWCRCSFVPVYKNSAANGLTAGANGGMIEEDGASRKQTSFMKRTRSQKMEYVGTKSLASPLSESEIIRKLGGPDTTGGSCASLAYAYVANKYAGLDVTDYRGGESRHYFANKKVGRSIATLDGVDGETFTATSEQEVVEKIARLDENKEYVLRCGHHAAIVKSVQGGAQYLELQGDTDVNGWYVLDEKSLRSRFATNDTLAKKKSSLASAESLAESDAFREMVGYINTNTNGGETG